MTGLISVPLTVMRLKIWMRNKGGSCCSAVSSIPPMIPYTFFESDCATEPIDPVSMDVTVLQSNVLICL